MTATLQDRPVALVPSGGGGPATRAIVRWAWRLFRREWRQQLLILALVTFAVAATTFGVALAYSAGQSQFATFGSANTLMTFPGTDRADIAAAHEAFGAVEEIVDQQVAIPGSLDTLDLRAQDPNGKFGHSTLRLVSGRYPSGAGEIAMTKGAAASFNARVGSRFVANGQARAVVGLVENPMALGNDFALVAPGQLDPPDQITLLFNATNQQVEAFHPTGDATGIGRRGGLHTTAAAAAVLALETIGLLFVGLVAAAGFAVMAQRRLRALGMLGALGATDRQVRLAMVANGAVVGSVGAVAGLVVGLVTWVGLAPRLERLARHRVDVWRLPWWAIAAAMMLAVLTAIGAAWWPARSVARASIVSALSGRPAPPKPAHRFASAGSVMLAAGFGCLAFADRSAPNSYLIIAGTVATTFGMLFLGPLFIRTLAVVGRRAPIALRLAIRDLARYQARSAAALGAISLALAIAATVAISASALAVPSAQANLAANQVMVFPNASNNFVFINGAAAVPDLTASEVEALRTRVDALARSIDARVVVPLTAALDPASGTFTTGPPADDAGGGANGVSITQKAPTGSSPSAASSVVRVPATLGKVHTFKRGVHSGIEITNAVPLYVATPALLRYYGINARDVAADTDVLSGRSEVKGLTITAPRGGPTPCDSSEPGCRVNGRKPTGAAEVRGPYQWHPKVQIVSLPKYTAAPDTMLTMHALRAFGLRQVPAGWLIETRGPLTASEINAARRSAAAGGITIDARKDQAGSYSRLRNGATAVGLLVALGVLAMTVGLIRSETADDLRTLAATGATSTTRRTLTGATAGALALLGALLGTGAAYLALIAWHRSDLHPLTQVPFADLVVIVVGLPLIAVTGGWLLAGREPADLGHRPLD